MRLSVTFLLLALSLGAGKSLSAEELNTESFARLRDVIAPRDEEQVWARIPWETSLWKAREKAAAEGKPILLWEMDGHPLGCT